MDENDNTVQPDVQAAPDQGQPAADTVVTETLDQTDTSVPSDASPAGEETPAAPEADDQLQKFAKSQGLDLDSPSAIKAAQIAMKARSEATRNYQKANELEKAANITQDQLPADLTPQQQENVRLRNLELAYGVQQWKMQNQDKLDMESSMVNILGDPIKKQLVQEGYLSLDDVYKLAKAEAPDNSAQVRSEGERAALERLAQKQQAAVPTGHATTQTPPKEKPFNELSIQEMEAKLGRVRY